MNKLAFLAIAAFAATSTNAEDLLIDTQTASYQQSVEKLAYAESALEKAVSRLEEAFVLQDYPGLDEQAFLETLEVLRGDLRVILLPERRRMEYLQVEIDGTFVVEDNILKQKRED